MNGGMIRFILGSVLKVESVLLLFPCIVAVFYRESAGYWFLLTAVLSFVIGYLLVIKKPANTVFYLKEGCVTTALSWIMISLVGCLPFYLSGEIPAFTDALFETISGFTTTGASILSDVECLSQSILFWQEFQSLDWRYGRACFPFGDYPAERRFTYEPDASGEPGAICGQAGAKGTCDSAYSLFNLFRHDHCRADFPAYWQNAVS